MKDLSLIAEKVRRQGRGADKILVHINPFEASQLDQKFGKRGINPHTGLPEYGGIFYGLQRLLGRPSNKKVQELKRSGQWRGALPHIAQRTVPLIAGALGSGLGTMLSTSGALGPLSGLMGPNVGAALAGAGAGALTNTMVPKYMRKSVGKAALTGGGLGWLGSHIANEGANLFDLDPTEGFGLAIGMRPSHIVPPSEYYERMKSFEMPDTIQGQLDELRQLTGMGGKGRARDFGDKILDTLDRAGNLGIIPGMDKIRKQKHKEENEISKQQPPSIINIERGVTSQGMPVTSTTEDIELPKTGFVEKNTTEYNSPFSSSDLLEVLLKMLQEHPERKEEILEEIRKLPGSQQRFRKGGMVKTGYIPGKDSGISDKVYCKIEPGSFVWNATDVSLLGDGNPQFGSKKIKQWEEHIDKTHEIPHSPIIRKEEGGKIPLINAAVSPTEHITPKRIIDKLGKGNNNIGARLAERMRHNLRKHKGVKHILPPKAKSLHEYMAGAF